MRHHLFDFPYSKYASPLTPVPTRMTPGGALRRPVRCILFDIYGTLFISGSGDIGAERKTEPRQDDLNALIHRYRLNQFSDQLRNAFFSAVETTHEKMKNRGIDVPEVEYDQIWASILPGMDPREIREFAAAYELIVNPVYPMPNLKTLLAGCRERALPLGIISNAQFFTPLLFYWFLGGLPESIGFDPDLLFYSYRYGVAKPSPVLFEAAASALKDQDIGVAEVLYVGNDMLNDVYAAEQAGFQTALFAGDARSLRLRKDDPRVETISPDLVVTELMQILDYV